MVNCHALMMSRITNTYLTILVTSLLITPNSYGSEQECMAVTVRESPDLHNQWEGAANPEMIPDFLKYQSFAIRYNVYLTELVQQLSSRDHAVLTTLTSESEYWLVSENERYTREFLNLCTNKLQFDPVSLAREYERAARESNNRNADRIREAITSLSSTGRQAVEEYISSVVTPKLSFPRKNSIDLAEEDPEGFLINFDIMCHLHMYGEPPPELKRAMECGEQQEAASTAKIKE